MAGNWLGKGWELVGNWLGKGLGNSLEKGVSEG